MELEDKDHKFQFSKTLEWNHGLGEIIQALLDEGLIITGLIEHKSLPWDALPGQMIECRELPGRWCCFSERAALLTTDQESLS